VAATVRIGTCSWADEGLVRHWYPRGVSSAEARLRYYAERFDVVEADSPFYRLPAPETAARWAERTPAGFVFHVKASGEMTGHREAELQPAFRDFRQSLGPLEASGKMRGVLLQYHPRVKKSPEALAELERVRGLLEPLVPLIEFRHRSWVTEDELADTLRFLERQGLPTIAAVTHPVAYVRFHGRNWRTWNIRDARSSAERFDHLYTEAELLEWVEPLGRLAGEAEEVYALFNNNRDDFAPRSAKILRGLLGEAGIPASGAAEPTGEAQLDLGV